MKMSIKLFGTRKEERRVGRVSVYKKSCFHVMSSLLRVKILSQFSEFEWAFFFIKIDILLRGRKLTGTVKRITYFVFL